MLFTFLEWWWPSAAIMYVLNLICLFYMCLQTLLQPWWSFFLMYNHYKCFSLSRSGEDLQLCHVMVLVSNLYFYLSADPFSIMMEFVFNPCWCSHVMCMVLISIPCFWCRHVMSVLLMSKWYFYLSADPFLAKMEFVFNV